MFNFFHPELPPVAKKAPVMPLGGTENPEVPHFKRFLVK
jgi:hypothetical protein